MSKDKPQLKLYIKSYWLYWIGFVVCILIASFYFPPHEKRIIFIIFLAISVGMLIVLYFYECQKIISHLKKYHYNKWAKLRLQGWPESPGAFNWLNNRTFLFSPDDLGDPTLYILKSYFRRFQHFLWAVLITLPIFAFVILR